MTNTNNTEIPNQSDLDSIEKASESEKESLPESPTFDIEVIQSDPTDEPVSTHNFCQVSPGSG